MNRTLPAPQAARSPRRLAPDEMAVVPALLKLPIGWVHPGKNVRGDIGDVTDLAASIHADKQLTPVLVYQTGEQSYTLLDGHRRHRAVAMAGKTHIDAILRRPPLPAERLLQQLNIQGHAKAVDPIAEARAVRELMREFGFSREQIAVKLGRSTAWVRDRAALLLLPSEQQQQVTRSQLPLGVAVAAAKQYRAARDGRAQPMPRHTRPCATKIDPHFTDAHPLALAAAHRCRTAAHHRRVRLGGVACGQCWEQSIRDDQHTQQDLS